LFVYERSCARGQNLSSVVAIEKTPLPHKNSIA
jgi:hypothetical protein